MIWKMAWRNLWRNKRRTIITVTSVAFGVWLCVTFTGIGEYGYTKMIDASAKMGMGHITLQPQGYLENPLLKSRLNDGLELAEKLSQRSDVTQAVARVSGYAMFATARKSVGAGFLGIDPAEEFPDTNIFIKNMKEGELFKRSDSRGAVIGSAMARKMKLEVGKRLIYTFTNIHGDLSSGRVKVTGIFETGIDEVDTFMVLLPRERVAADLGFEAGEATLVSIYIKDQAETASIAQQLSKDLPAQNGVYLTYAQTQPNIAGMVAMDRRFNYVMQFILGLLISVGIFNTLLMSVMERKQEFGIMMAVGLSPLRLFGMIIAESSLIGFLGLIAGTIMTAPWYYYLKTVGLDFSAMAGENGEALDMGGVPIDLIYRILITPNAAVIIASALMILTLAAGLVPAWKAGHITPVESIRGL